MNHVPSGKIGKLPFDLREELNRKLRDNVPGPKIIAWLNQEHAEEVKATGYETIKRKNLCSWRTRGYKDWLRQQERLAEMKAQRELAFEIAQQGDGSVPAANLAMAANHIYEVLQDFDVRDLKARLQEKPELYPAIIGAASRLSRAGLDERKLQLELTKYQDKVADQKKKLEQGMGPKGGGITPETIAKIEEAMGLL